MPRDEDIAWKHVERLEGKKWRCKYCGKVSNGQVTRVKSHLGQVKGKGIDICTGVPVDIRDLMLSLLKKEAEEGSRQANHQSSTERLSRDMPMLRPVQNVHQDVSFPQPSHELVGPSLPMPGGVADMANFTHQLTSNRQSQGGYQLHRSSTMPSLAQNEQGASVASQIVLQSDCALNPNDTENSNQPGCTPGWPSCYWQTGIGTASACPQYPVYLPPDNMPLDNLGTTQQPNLSNHRLDVAHGNEIASFLEQLSLASISLDPSELLLDQATHLETGNEQYDQVFGNSTSNRPQEFIAGDVLPDPRLSNITTTSIPQYSHEQYPSSDNQFADGITSYSPLYSTNWSNPHDSPPENLVESHDVIVNTPDEMQTNELHNPTVGSSLQNDSSIDVDTTNRLEDCSQPCEVEVVPELSNTSPTNAVQHPDQLHPRCDKEDGNDTRLFPSPTPPDIDPPIASSHSSDSHNFEAKIDDLQVPEAATNATGPSSSQDMNGGSPIMNVRSVYANDEEIRNLKRKVKELDYKEADINEQMEIESATSSVRKKPRKLVQKWLKEMERARNNFQIIGQTNAETLPPKEQVETLTREVEELIEQKLPQTLLIEARDAKGDAFLERKLIGEEIHRNIELIWDRLKENHVCKLGIYGMGGVGKTTIMMHIHNRLLKDETFDGVLFVTVSQDFSIYKLQSDIWNALKFGIMGDEHEKKRAVMLSERLERLKNCVLIFDDVWQHFKLQDVGIRDRAGPKVVLTTRFSEVCSRMDCEEIKIQPLCEEEAWKLFVEELGPKPLTNTRVEEVARKIVNRCAGLPLAINTMASSLRGEKNFFVWQDTLIKLERSDTKHTEMGDRVLSVLSLSYERLSNPQVKQCFLFCALFPEDARIGQKELIEYFIDEGFLDELDTRDAQYYRGLAIVDMLQKACLLEVDYDQIRMHDLIREMALHITSTAYMVKAGWGLQRIPNGEHWTEGLEKVSLMRGYIEDIPPDMSPNCPKLSTLLLNGSLQSENVQLKDSFFTKLQGLKVLNLSGCTMRELPDSLSELVNLRALLLRYCTSLLCIPHLRKLKFLRKLDTQGCESLIEVQGLEELVNLRYLNLYNTRIERLLEGTLRRMVNLQYLRVTGTVEVEAEEVIQLKALERLECNFGNVDDFNKYVRFIERSSPRPYHYNLFVDQGSSVLIVNTHVYPNPLESLGICKSYGRKVDMIPGNCTMARVGKESNNDSILIPGDVELFRWSYCHGMTNLSGVGLLRCLKELQLYVWDDLVVLFGGDGADEEEVRNIRESPASVFPSLERLEIEWCSKLKYLFGHESGFSLSLGGPAFPRLEYISVTDCGNMERLVGSEWLPHFPNLRTIKVENCNSIRELPWHDGLLHLPNLEHITVIGYQGIEGIISRRGENHGGSPPLNTPSSSLPTPFSPYFPNLRKIEVRNCNNIRELLPHEYLLHLPNLEHIKVNRCKGLEEIISRRGENHGRSPRPPLNTPSSSSSSPFCPHFPNLRAIEVRNCNNIRELLPHEYLLHLPNLEHIKVRDCEGTQEMISGGGENHGASAPPNTASSSLPSPFFPNLRKIEVRNCNNIRELLSRECLPHFPNLEHIDVRGCEGIEEIISEGGENRGENHEESAPLNTHSSSLPTPFSSPKLQRLVLYQLPQLKSIMWEGALSFIPGAFVHVDHCTKLKTIPPCVERLRASSIALWKLDFEEFICK